MRGTDRLPVEVEAGLWELVTAGLITGHAFYNLRALIDPRRRGAVASPLNADARPEPPRWGGGPSWATMI